MAKRIFLTIDNARLLAGATFLAVLTGCMVDNSSGYQGHAQTTVTFEDDYDYYPGYETYYSRNRHEYVYREGNVWVRRPEPRGVSASVFLAAPSVRLDFHDSPEQHHRTVIQSYPKTWKRPEVNHATKPEQPAVRREQPEAKPEQQPANRNNDAKDVRQAPQHRQPEANPNHPENQRENGKNEHPDNKQDDKKDDDKGPNRRGD